MNGHTKDVDIHGGTRRQLTQIDMLQRRRMQDVVATLHTSLHVARVADMAGVERYPAVLAIFVVEQKQRAFVVVETGDAFGLELQDIF